jgi:type II secretory pathway component PulF
MTRLQKMLILEFWFFIWLPVMAVILVYTLKLSGLLLFMFLFVFWCWQLFAYSHYRFCRQEEFLYVLQTAADSQAPIESLLKAYLRDRPRDEVYRFWLSTLLTFVFPGYYWVHKQRSYDARLSRLAAMMQSGASLNQALRYTPGLVSREIALAVTVGQFSGKLAPALKRLPDRRFALQWLEMMPRLVYPLLVILAMLVALSFIVIFIIPKFEKIFLDLKLQLPEESEWLIAVSRWGVKYWYVAIFAVVLAIVVGNLLILSSRFRWYLPVIGGIYRQYARGQFLQVLGLMLETGKPLPEILGCIVESGFLPSAVADRAGRLTRLLQQGEPLPDSLVKTGLATEAQRALIASAEKAQNLPWALQSLGDSAVRGAAHFTQRLSLVIFPLLILLCGLFVGFAAIAVFKPLVELMEGLHV